MKEFLTWYGWSAISAIAQILSLATIAIAAWRFVVQRRQMPIFALTWDFIGTATRDGHQFHLVEFRNVGRGAGEFIAFYAAGARAHLADGFLTPKVLGSNESFRLLITAPDLEAAWVRHVYRTTDHRARFQVRWGPMLSEGSRADQYRADQDRWDERSYFEVWRDRVYPRAVGPGQALQGTIRARHSPSTMEAILTAGDLTSINHSLLAGTDNPFKLPFVPGPTKI